MAVQYTLSGKLPIRIIDPNVLHSIARNISLFAWKLWTHCRYQICYHSLVLWIKVTAVGTAHGSKLILEVPLKTESQHFTLYRIIALPTRVLNDTFAVYQLEYKYFGLSYSQRDYILMTAADVQKCSTEALQYARRPELFMTLGQVTCGSKLYFQTATKDGPCRRSLMLHWDTYLVAAWRSVDLPFSESASSDY